MNINKNRAALVLIGMLVATGTGAGRVINGEGGLFESGVSRAAAAVMSTLADPLSLFRDRSPGERAAGAMTQTKRRYAYAAAHAGFPPDGHAAGRLTRAEYVRDGVLTSIPLYGPDAGAGGNTPVESVVLLPPGPPIYGFVPPPPMIDVPVVPFVPIGPADDPEPFLPPAPPPPAAVPEPAAWTMLIVGFAAMGMTMRRRRTAAAAAGR